jgi:hypothetical protein
MDSTEEGGSICGKTGGGPRRLSSVGISKGAMMPDMDATDSVCRDLEVTEIPLPKFGMIAR